MPRQLTKAQLVTQIEDEIDEDISGGNGKFSAARVARAINRALEYIGNNAPCRMVEATLTGDGTTTLFVLPEPIADVDVYLDSQLPMPKLSHRALRMQRKLTLLAGSTYSDYGFAITPYGDDRVLVSPTLASGETSTFYYWSQPGRVRETPYSTGTVSVTKDSATITGSGTTWTSNATAGDGIEINSVYYVIKSVDSDTSIVLTEKVREATASGLSYEIGGSLGVPANWNECLVLSVVYRLFRSEGRQDWQTYYNDFRREFRIQAAVAEQKYRADIMMGQPS